jgi:hypothetical protein
MIPLPVGSLFVAISATTASRSRVMFAVIGAYFILVPFWAGFLPAPLTLGTILDTVASLLGVTISESTRELVGVLSPANAYFQITEEAYAGVIDQYEIFRQFEPESDALARQPWFTVSVLLGWATLVPLVSYLKFRNSELG